MPSSTVSAKVSVVRSLTVGDVKVGFAAVASFSVTRGPPVSCVQA